VPVSLLEVISSLRSLIGSVEVELYSGEDCAVLAEELARTEKSCSGLRLLLAERAVSCNSHLARGFPSGVAWLAQIDGSTTHQARQGLSTAALLSRLPATRAALLAGEVSSSQAGEIARTEETMPGAECELLDSAKKCDLSHLREAARRYVLERCDPASLHKEQMRSRSFRHHRNRIGMICFEGALPPESGLPFVRRIDEEAQRRYQKARREGRAEAFEAHAADALLSLCTGEGRATRPRQTELVIVCDLRAYRRGHGHPGEVCHTIGGGPLPVGLARELAKDAFLKAVLHDGVTIHTVSHHGRYLKAELRTALELGPVPKFTGEECAECQRTYGLERDHIDPVANNGRTEYSNLEPLCWNHHQQKTERDRKAGLLGPHPP
jgi:hypothetical protein